MAKFLTTVGSSSSIEEIIRTAERELTIITPFVQLSDAICERLEEASDSNILITVITRVTELNRYTVTTLRAIPAIELFDCPNLHAKCYSNETRIALTSMNLYEFSERNNREMGIELTSGGDPQLFAAIIKEIASIKRSSELIKEAILIDSVSISENIKKFSLGKEIVLPVNQKVIRQNEFNDRHNSYLPTLNDVLKKTYSGLSPTLASKLTIDHFPIRGIGLRVESHLAIDFDSNDAKNEFRENFESKIQAEIPEIRCFWNRGNINIYPIGSDIEPSDDENLLLKTQGYLKTINYMSNLIVQMGN